MSATNVLVQSDRVHLMTDAAVYHPDGILAGIAPKVRAMPHISCAVAMRGVFLAWAPIMEEISAAPSFDCLKDGMPKLLEDCAIAYRHLLDQCAAGPAFEVVVAGISETGGPSAYLVAGHDRYGEPWQVIDLAGLTLLPMDEGIRQELLMLLPPGTEPDSVDPVAHGLEAMEIQRRHPKLDNGDVCCIGGFAQLTTVTADAVTSRILHRWPDEIGMPISDLASGAPAGIRGRCDQTA